MYCFIFELSKNQPRLSMTYGYSYKNSRRRYFDKKVLARTLLPGEYASSRQSHEPLFYTFPLKLFGSNSIEL